MSITLEKSPQRIRSYDVGGTWTRHADYTPRGDRLSPIEKTATPRGSAPLLINHIATSAVQEPKPDAVAISFGGPTTAEGVIVRAPNIWSHQETYIPLAAETQQRTGIPTSAVNDMTASAWREKQTGIAFTFPSFLIVTVSSGVGSKLFQNGEVLLGENGIAGEIGHFVMDPNSKLQCGCGQWGHLESFASGIAAERIARERAAKDLVQNYASSALHQWTQGNPGFITNDHLSQLRAENDPLSFLKPILEEVTQPLALGINHIWAMSAFEHLVLIGGFALGIGDPYFSALKSRLFKIGLMGIHYPENSPFWNGFIVKGSADDESGLIGAAVAAANRFGLKEI